MASKLLLVTYKRELEEHNVDLSDYVLIGEGETDYKPDFLGPVSKMILRREVRAMAEQAGADLAVITSRKEWTSSSKRLKLYRFNMYKHR